MVKRLLSAFVGIVTCFLISIEAQNSPPRRPVVGIALSGGGALGLAHIGVLRYLEEHRIPVDRIAGTSMGGLLGGLYATGHRAADLNRIIKEADWDDLLRTAPRFLDRPVAEKQEWNRVTGRYTLQLANGFALPSGLNPGQSLTLLLSGETAAYADVQNFSDLPIPFRCVATDLLSGEAFILREGYLTKALRATMAIPGIFTPVEWDGRILSDGGLANNLPTDVVKDMGADVIIGVTLRISPMDAQELQSITDILRQSLNIALVQNELRNAPLADIEIAVQLGNRRSLDFSDTESIIELGYQAAANNASMLEKYSISPEAWEQYRRTLQSRRRTVPPVGPLLGVSTRQPVIQRNAERELARKLGPNVTRDRLENNLSGLTAATGLPSAFYGWHSEGERSGYKVELTPRRNTEAWIRPSFFYQLSKGEAGRPTLRLSTTTIPQNAYKSRLLADVSLGPNPAMVMEYYHPFNGSAYFIAPGLSLERTHFSVYTDKERISSPRDRFAGSLYGGIGTWRHVQLRAGAEAGFDKYGNAINLAGQGRTPASNTLFLNPEIIGTINAQDSGLMPTQGFRLNASTGWSFRTHSYPYVQLNFDHFQPILSKLSVFAMGQADTSFGRSLSLYDQFTAGGLVQLDAYRDQELRGDSLVVGGGGVLYRPWGGASLRPILGSWYQAAGEDSSNQDWRFRQSATLGVLTPTPVGLVGFTFSADLRGSTRFRMSIGSFWNRP